MKSRKLMAVTFSGILLLNACSDNDNNNNNNTSGTPSYNPIGGGLAVLDIGTMELEAIVPLPTTLTMDEGGNPTITRFVHTYMDPDQEYLWMNNDGVDNAVDSAFRIDVDPASPDYLSHNEIVVGHGHKKSAFAYPSVNTPSAMNLFVTHNLQEQSISIIDNDPVSATFLEVLDTVELSNGIPFQNTVHGMGFSTVSGHIYTGVTPGVDKAVSIIDATDPALGRSLIMAGMAADQIPAAGYVKVSHDGRWVMTVGYVNETGYLSIIDATTDTVTDVINLGNLSASSFNIADMDMGMGMRHVKIFIPSRQTSASDTEITNQIAVVDFDHMTGMQTAATAVRYIDVGEGPAHRNGEISEDGFFAYYPNGGDCGHDHATHGPGCQTISVIDVMMETVIGTLTTEGHEPGSVSVFNATDVDPAATEKFYIFATDHEGYINIYTHNSDDTFSEAIAPMQPLNLNGESISVREPHLANGKLFVPIGSGVVQ